jgi:hypothetical protein
MATYKVIQDIEAEDHILGPLSLRQFIFAIVAVVCFYLSYLLYSKHVGFLTPLFLLPGLFAAFFAFPFGKDQPTEIWALAKIRFLFKPRRRIWDQSGVKELVTVTVPKHVEEHRTNGLSENEVKSRLSALASTIDSRGWAIKNVNVNLYSQPGFQAAQTDSDRLVDIDSLPQEVPNYDVQASDDILDAQNNPIAHQFDQLINASSQEHRQQLMTMMSQPATPAPQPAAVQPADYWFLNQSAQPAQLAPGQATFAQPPVVLPGVTNLPTARVAAEPTAEEEAFAAQLKAQHDQPDLAYGRMKTIQPIDPMAPVAPVVQPAPAQPAPIQPVASNPSPTTQRLANNNDLNIATIAREAQRANQPIDQSARHFGDDEVVISLH